MIDIYECDTTSDGKTSGENIVYSHGGLKPLKRKLAGMAKIKPIWGLEVLESDGEYSVKFERFLTIKVPKEFWDEFKQLLKIEGSKYEITLDECIIGNKSVDLVEHLIDQVPDEINKEIRCVDREFRGLIYSKNFKVLESEINTWCSLFGGKHLLNENVLIQHHLGGKFFSEFSRSLRREFCDDLGGIQILRYNIQNENLTKLPKFIDKRFLYGAKIQSIVEGKTLVFEILWDRDFSIKESIYIDSSLLSESLDTLGVCRRGSLIVPSKNNVFGKVILEKIHSIIMEED